jgi:predicted transcriptional regulator
MTMIITKKKMKLHEIKELLECEVVWADAELLELDIERAGAADMMSDILAFIRAGSLMLTGLVNIQSVRTADIAEIRAIIYVRGKKPTPDAIELAKEKKIPLLSTNHFMYDTCGILYSNGILGHSDA